MTIKDFERIYQLDIKDRTKEENKEFKKLLNLLKTYDLIPLYNQYRLNKKKEGV